MYVDSLVMLSDGIHNGSDALALVVAFWAEKTKMSHSHNNLT